MVAVISGEGLGLLNSSGTTGATGDASLGNSRERIYVNGATGNLVIQGQDEFLTNTGLDQALIRTYNSQGLLNDDNGDNWRLNTSKQLINLPANSASPVVGDTITRIDGDGAEATYTYDGNHYVTQVGDGAFDTLDYSNNSWIWTDGTTGITETYQQQSDGSWRVTHREDPDGNHIDYTYTTPGTRGPQLTSLSLSDAQGNNTQSIALTYSGDNLASITTTTLGTSNVQQTRVRYGYDSLNRLVQVIVDLTPEDSDVGLPSADPNGRNYVTVNDQVYVTNYYYVSDSGADANRIASITEGDGSSIAFTYDAVGRVSTVTQDGRSTTFAYDSEAVAGTSSAAVLSAGSSATQIDRTLSSGYVVRASDLASSDPWAAIATNIYGTPNAAGALRNTLGDPILQAGGVLHDIPVSLTYTAPYTAQDVPADSGGTNSLYFDGVNDYVQIGDPKLGNGPFTIQAWVNIENLTGSASHGIINSTTDGGQVGDFNLYIDSNGRVSFQVWRVPGANAGLFVQSNSGIIQQGQWYLITAVWDGVQNHVYVDGKKADSTRTTTWSTVPAGQFIGNAGFVGNTNFTLQGQIDDLQLYTRALDINEVYAPSSEGLKAHWDFNDAANATTLTDRVGSNHGTLVNMDTATVWRTDGAYSLIGTDQPSHTVVASGATVKTTDAVQQTATVTPYYTVTADDLSGATVDDHWAAIAIQLYGSSAIANELRAALDDPQLHVGTELTGLPDSLSLYDNYSAAELPAQSTLNAVDIRDAYGYIDLSQPLHTGDTPFSVESWINPDLFDAFSTYGEAVVSSLSVDSAPAAGDFILAVAGINDWTTAGTLSGRLQFFYWHSELDASGNPIVVGQRYMTDQSTLTVNAWQHVMASWDGTTAHLYINGVEQNISADSTVPTFYPAGYEIGTSYWGYKSYTFDGQIDEVRVYDRALAANEIFTYPTNGLTGYWALNGDATDSVGTNNGVNISPAYSPYVSDGAYTLLGTPKSVANATYTLDSATLLQNGTLQDQKTYYETVTVNPYYVVQTGDTWSSIAALLYGSSGVAVQLQADYGNAATPAGRLDNLKASYIETVADPVYVVTGTDLSHPVDPWISIAINAYGTDNPALVKALKAQLNYPALSVGQLLTLPASVAYTDTVYQATAHRTESIDNEGRVTSYLYDGNDRLIEVIAPALADGSRPSVSYTYTASGEIASVTDSSGRNISYTYNNGNRTYQRDSEGNTVEYAYNSVNRLLRETTYITPDPDGAGPASAQDPQVARYIYDTSNPTHLRYSVSADGRVTQYIYNSLTGLLETTLVYTDSQYDLSAVPVSDNPTLAQLDSWVQVRNTTHVQRTDTTYDARGNVSTMTTYGNALANGSTAAATAHTTQYIYDQMGQLLFRIDARNNAVGSYTEQTAKGAAYVTHYAYDGLGRQLELTRANDANNSLPAAVTSTRYDDVGHRIETTQANGLIRTTVYDSRGLRVSVQQSDAQSANLATTRYGYDNNGRLIYTRDATGVATFNVYDNDGRLVATVDGNGSITESSYDDSGNIIETIAYATALTAEQLQSLINSDGRPNVVPLAALRPAATGDDRHTHLFYDQANRLVYTVDAEGYVTQAIYDGKSQLTETIAYANPLSLPANATTADVEGAIAAQAISDPVHDRHTHTYYDADGNTIGQLDAEGYLTEYHYDGAGQLSQAIAHATQHTNFLAQNFTTEALDLASVIANVGNSPDDIRTFNFYNDQGQLVGSADGEGYLTETFYDKAGNVKQTIRYVEKAIGLTSGSRIDDVRPGINQVIDATGQIITNQVTDFVYNARNQIASRADYNGNVTEWIYDEVGHVIAQTTRDVADTNYNNARTLSTQYDVQGRLIKTLTAEGKVKLDQLLSGTFTQQDIDTLWAQYGISHTYDAVGRRTSTTDQWGNTTYYYYNEDNQLRFSVNALGEVKELQYNTFGEVKESIQYATRLSATNLATIKTSAGGLLNSLVQGVIVPAASNSDVHNIKQYTVRGAVKAAIDGENYRTEYSYDAFGELIGQRQQINQANNGAGINNALTDASGNPVSTYQSSLTKLDYDRRGQTIKTTHDVDVGGLTISTQNHYDAFGRVASVTDGNGNTTRYDYDKRGLVTTTTDALNQQHITTYDAFGRSLTQTDVRGNTTIYSYDDAGRTLTITTPEGISTITTRNAFGETITVQDGNNNITQYDYDLNGNLTQVTEAVGTADEIVTQVNNYSDAAAGLYNRLVDSTDSNGNTVHYEYDAANRLQYRTVDPNGLNITTQTQYDAVGHKIQVIEGYGTAESRTTQTHYDHNGRVTDVVVDPNGLNIVTHYTFDGSGNTLNVTEGYGAATARTTQYFYDKNNRMKYTVNAAGSVTQLQYDGNNNVTAKVQFSRPVSSVNLNNLDISFLDQVYGRAWDLGENRISLTVYDALNRVTYRVDPTGDITQLGTITQYIYDTNGNVIETTKYADTIYTTIFDSKNPKLDIDNFIAGTRAHADQDRTTYAVYDQDNRQIYSVNALGAITHYVYDGNNHIIQQTAYADAIALVDVSDSAARQVNLNKFVASSRPHAADDRTQYTVYDKANRIHYTINALGYVTENTYNGLNQLSSVRHFTTQITIPATVTDEAINAIRNTSGFQKDTLDRFSYFVYDKAGRQQYTIDALGYVSENAYNAFGQVETQHRYAAPIDVAAINATATISDVQFTLANRANPQSEHDEVTQTDYDTRGKIIAKQYGVGTADVITEHFIYNEFNEVIRHQDGRGNSEYFSYDSAGNQLNHVDYMGYLVTRSYNAFSEAENETTYMTTTGSAPSNDDYWAYHVSKPAATSDDRVVSTHYDYLGRIDNVTDGEGIVTKTVYSELGDITDIIKAYGTADAQDTHRVTNVAGQLTSETTAYNTGDAATTKYQYNIFNEQTGIIDPRGVELAETDTNWALAQRLDLGYINGSGGVLLASELSTAQKQALLALYTTSQEFDKAYRKTAAIDPLGGRTQTDYNTLGDIYRIIDPNKNQVYLYHDQLGRLAMQVDPEGYVTETKYDAFGNVVDTVRYTNAVTGQLGASIQPEVVTDVPVNPTSAYILLDTGQDQHTTATYDAHNRTVKITDPNGNAEYFAYDPVGNVTKKTDKNGYITRYEYDANRNLTFEHLPVRSTVNEWDPTAQIAQTNSGGVVSQQVVKDKNGNCYVVWIQSEGGTDSVKLRFYTEQDSWQNEISVSIATTGIKVTDLHLKTSANGIVVVWTEFNGTDYTIFSREFLSEGGLGEINTIGVSSSATSQFDMNKNGNGMIVFDQNGTTYSRLFTPGKGWQPAVAIDNAGYGGSIADLSIDSEGNAFSIWTAPDQNNEISVYAQQYLNESGWQNVSLLEQNVGDAGSSPKIAAFAGGNALAIWTQNLAKNTSSNSLFANTFIAGEGWQGVEDIGSLSYGGVFNVDADPKISADNFGNATVVWTERSTDSINVNARPFNISTGWGFTEFVYVGTAVSVPIQAFVDVAISDNGDKFVYYQIDDSAGESINIRRHDEKDWTPLVVSAQDLSGSLNFENLDIAVDDQGNATLIWSVNDGKTDTINVRQFWHGKSVVNEYQYDASGNRTKKILASGLQEAQIFQYHYDKNNRLVEKIEPIIQSAELANNILTEVQLQPISNFIYDSNGNLIKKEEGSGDRITYNFYDYRNRKIASVDAERYLDLFTYDSAGNLIEQRRFEDRVPVSIDLSLGIPDPSVIPDMDETKYRATTYRYDQNSRLVETSSRAVFLYDRTNGARLEAVITRKEYDANGNVVVEEDANGNRTYHFYDSRGLSFATIDPEGYIVSKGYDSFGNLVRETQHSQQISPQDRQALTANTDPNELIAKMTLSGSSDDRITTYMYDSNNKLTRKNNLIVEYLNQDKDLLTKDRIGAFGENEQLDVRQNISEYESAGFDQYFRTDAQHEKPEIVRAGSEIYSVWSGIDNNKNVFFSFSRYNQDIGAWSAATTFRTYVSTGLIGYSVAGNKSGELVLVWANSSYVNSVTYDPNLQQWGKLQLLGSGPSIQNSPKVALDDAGNIAVVWGGYDPQALDYSFYFNYYQAKTGTWFDNSTLSPIDGVPNTAFEANLSMDNDGNVLVAWTEHYNNNGVHSYTPKSRFFIADTMQWMAVEDLDIERTRVLDPSLFDYNPEIRFLSNGDAVAIWARYNSSDDTHSIVLRRFDRATRSWQTSVSQDVIATTARKIENLEFDIDKDGNMLVVWRETHRIYGSSNDELVHSSYYNNTTGTWTAPQILNDSYGTATAVKTRVPTVKFNQFGNALVTWIDPDNYSGFHLNIKLFDKNTNTFTKINWDAKASTQASVEFDDAGNALIIRDITLDLDFYTYILYTSYVMASKLSISTEASPVLSHVQRGTSTTQYQYDANGNLVSVIDSNQAKTQFYYDGNNRNIRVIEPKFKDFEGDAVRKITTTVYNGVGDIVRTTVSGLGKQYDQHVRYQYDAHGNIISQQDAEGFVSQYYYDIYGNRILEVKQQVNSFNTAPKTVYTQFSYDDLNRQTLMIDGENYYHGVAYNAYGQIVSKGRAQLLLDINDIYFEYDYLGHIVRTNNEDGVNRVYLYDANGNNTAKIEPGRDGVYLGNDVQNPGYLTISGIESNLGINDVHRIEYSFNERNLRTGTHDQIQDTQSEPFYTVLPSDLNITGFNNAWEKIVQEIYLGGFDTTVRVQLANELASFYQNVTLTAGLRLYNLPRFLKVPGSESPLDAGSGNYYALDLTKLTSDSQSGPENIDSYAQYNAFREVTSKSDFKGNVTEYTYNNLGLVSSEKKSKTYTTNETGSVTYSSPTTTNYYNLKGQIVLQKDPENHITMVQYDDSGNLINEFHADGGVKQYGYDVFGNMRYMEDEVNNWKKYEYDRKNQLVKIYYPYDETILKSGVPDYDHYELFTLDQDGNRIAQRNGLGNWSYTQYDRIGRVNRYVSYGGRNTYYNYFYDATNDRDLKLTLYNDMSSSWEYTDKFGRIVYTEDQGRRTYRNFYNNRGLISYQIANTRNEHFVETTPGSFMKVIDADDDNGKLSARTNLLTDIYDVYSYTDIDSFITSNQNLDQIKTYSYSNNGMLMDVKDYGADNRAQYRYDRNGNRTLEMITNLDGTDIYQNSKNFYDEQNRVYFMTDSNVDIAYEYDKNGNRRRIRTNHKVAATGPAQLDNWYKYDEMNRVLIRGGFDLLNGNSGNINHRLSTGNGLIDIDGSTYGTTFNTAGNFDVAYDQVGNRVMKKSSGSIPYFMVYNSQNQQTRYLISGVGQHNVQSSNLYDSAGNKVKSFNYLHYNHTYLYNLDNEQISDSYIYDPNKNALTITTDHDDLGNVTSIFNQQPDATFYTNYEYEYWMGARQKYIKTDPTLKTGGDWAPGQSKISYDVNGNLQTSEDVVGNKRIIYTYDYLGHIVRKVELDTTPTDPATDPVPPKIQKYFFINGNPVAQLGDFDATGVDYVDFDNFQAVAKNDVPNSNSTYTVRLGDTLESIAIALWGDGSLWHILADANGLVNVDPAAELVDKTVLTIPGITVNVHNNASTFKPYSPYEIIGDLSPTLPDPPPPPRPSAWETFVMIVITVIIISYFPVGMEWAGAMLANYLSQRYMVAKGYQDEVNYGGVVAAGISSAALSGAGLDTTTVEGAATANIFQQTIELATGAREEFDWGAVAVAAITAPVIKDIDSEKMDLSTDALPTNSNSTEGPTIIRTLDEFNVEIMKGITVQTVSALVYGNNDINWGVIAGNAVVATARSVNDAQDNKDKIDYFNNHGIPWLMDARGNVSRINESQAKAVEQESALASINSSQAGANGVPYGQGYESGMNDSIYNMHFSDLAYQAMQDDANSSSYLPQDYFGYSGADLGGSVSRQFMETNASAAYREEQQRKFLESTYSASGIGFGSFAPINSGMPINNYGQNGSNPLPDHPALTKADRSLTQFFIDYGKGFGSSAVELYDTITSHPGDFLWNAGKSVFNTLNDFGNGILALGSAGYYGNYNLPHDIINYSSNLWGAISSGNGEATGRMTFGPVVGLVTGGLTSKILPAGSKFISARSAISELDVPNGNKASFTRFSGDYDTHITLRDFDVPRRRGIGGAHNSDEFFKYSNEFNVVESIPHPSVEGVQRVRYQMATLDRAGNPTGGFNAKVLEKTIYDPKVISNDKMLQWGREAAAQAQTAGPLNREWIGTSANGIQFRGYLDDTGAVRSFFPDY